MTLDITNQQVIGGEYNDEPKVFQSSKEGLLISSDTGLEIARGAIPGVSALNKFGLNPNVGTSEVTIWDAGGMYEWITTASVLDIQSDNSADTNTTGTGAWTVNIQGLDSDYNEISETIELNGVNTVNTTNTYLRVFRMSVITAGTGGEAVGIISAKIGATTYAQADNGNNQSLMSLYTVPAGKSAYLTYGKAATGAGKDATVYFKIRPLGGVFNVGHVAYVIENSYDYKFNPPLAIPEKADIMVTAIAGQSSTSVSAVFDLVLIDND